MTGDKEAINPSPASARFVVAHLLRFNPGRLPSNLIRFGAIDLLDEIMIGRVVSVSTARSNTDIRMSANGSVLSAVLVNVACGIGSR